MKKIRQKICFRFDWKIFDNYWEQNDGVPQSQADPWRFDQKSDFLTFGQTFIFFNLTPPRQARETYVCVNLLRKRNILIKYYFDTFQNKTMLKKIKIL